MYTAKSAFYCLLLVFWIIWARLFVSRLYIYSSHHTFFCLLFNFSRVNISCWVFYCYYDSIQANNFWTFAFLNLVTDKFYKEGNHFQGFIKYCQNGIFIWLWIFIIWHSSYHRISPLPIFNFVSLLHAILYRFLDPFCSKYLILPSLCKVGNCDSQSLKVYAKHDSNHCPAVILFIALYSSQWQLQHSILIWQRIIVLQSSRFLLYMVACGSSNTLSKHGSKSLFDSHPVHLLYSVDWDSSNTLSQIW